MFFAMVVAMPMIPLARSMAAAHSCTRVDATASPAAVSPNEISWNLIEWGRNANGWTSVR